MGGDARSRASTGSARVNQRVSEPIRGITGSVGSLMHVISDFHKEFGARVLDRPALHVLRATKCERILLLDDFIGSGDRAVSYLEAFYRHPTIKSWCSYPGLRITIICHAASAAGLGRLSHYRRHRDFPRPHPVEVQFVQGLYNGRSFWSDVERLSVVTLCRKYAPRTGRRRFPLGYSDTCSMIVFPYAEVVNMSVFTRVAGAALIALLPVSSMLAPGATIPLPSSTAASEPDLAGVVLHDALIPFTIKDTLGRPSCVGRLQDRVVRSTKTGLLHFYYRIRGGRPLRHGISTVATVKFGVDTLNVGWRLDGLGTVNPVAASRDPGGDMVQFNFKDPVLRCGSDSRFFFIKTMAKNFGPGRRDETDADHWSERGAENRDASALIIGSALVGLGRSCRLGTRVCDLGAAG